MLLHANLNKKRIKELDMELAKSIQSSFKNEYEKMAVNIIYTANWLQLSHSKQLKFFGISIQQYNILRILRGQYPNPATVHLLTERMLDKMSNASRLVEKLRLKDLIERRECLKDRRAVDVIITQKGLDVLSELDGIQKNWEQQLKVLTVSEAQMLNQLLDKLRK